MKRSEIVFGALRLPIDYLAALGAFLLAYRLRPITDLIPGVQYHFFPEQLPLFSKYASLGIFSAGFLVILFAGSGLYSLKTTRKFAQELWKILFWVSAWLMFIIAYHFLVLHELFFSRIALAHIWLFAVVFVLAGRILMSALQSFALRFGVGRRRVLFIGFTEIADQIYEDLKKDSRYLVLGALADKLESRKRGTLQIIGTLDQLRQTVAKYTIDELIQADPDAGDKISSDLLSFCRSNQIQYSFIPDLVKLQRTNVDIEMFGEMPLIRLKQTPMDGWGHIYKRGFDFILSSLLLAFLLPAWILLPIVIKCDSGGHAIYKSKRRYRDKIFNVYKFRSMVADADFKKTSLLPQNERHGPLFKIKNDPRITRIGKFLRKTSLDELPQLFNVFIGNMSLVGPRPHLPEEVEKYEARHYRVFALKPGITGLAQISGRSELDFEEEVKLDVYYIENWSIWLDIKILFKTLGTVLRREGS